MLTFIQRIFKIRPINSDAGPTEIDRAIMTLEERKTCRLEWICKSVEDTFYKYEIPHFMYKFKPLPIDSRFHNYIVVIEPSIHFALVNKIESLVDVEDSLRKKTYDRYGISICGIYWKACDSFNLIKHTLPPEVQVIDDINDIPVFIEATTFGFAPTDIMEKEDFVPTQPFQDFEPFSVEEAQAFREALAAGAKLPVVHVHGKVYNTDLAPLGQY